MSQGRDRLYGSQGSPSQGLSHTARRPQRGAPSEGERGEVPDAHQGNFELLQLRSATTLMSVTVRFISKCLTVSCLCR